jgi:hypothetical protein
LAAADTVLTECDVGFRKWPFPALRADWDQKQADKQMTGNESRLLYVGARVRWGGDEEDQGTVTATSWSGVTLKWDNRGEQSVLHVDMTMVAIVSKK